MTSWQHLAAWFFVTTKWLVYIAYISGLNVNEIAEVKSAHAMLQDGPFLLNKEFTLALAKAPMNLDEMTKELKKLQKTTVAQLHNAFQLHAFPAMQQWNVSHKFPSFSSMSHVTFSHEQIQAFDADILWSSSISSEEKQLTNFIHHKYKQFFFVKNSLIKNQFNILVKVIHKRNRFGLCFHQPLWFTIGISSKVLNRLLIGEVWRTI